MEVFERTFWLYWFLTLGIPLLFFGLLGVFAWCAVEITKATVRYLDAKTREQEIQTELGYPRRARENADPADSRYMPKKSS